MSELKRTAKTVTIIGGGPAGLMAAEVLSHSGAQIKVYDAMPSVGRKFLMAGKGGMNISHAEPFDAFLSRYGSRADAIKPLLQIFGPDRLRDWLHGLGINTFIGSSGRVFPRDMKAAPLLRAWLHRLRTDGVQFYMRQRWLGWTEQGALRFSNAEGEYTVTTDAVVLALGGGSWAKLGSDGAWVPVLQQYGINVTSLQPSNCGFEVAWSEHFKSRYVGAPVKAVAAFGQHDPASRQYGEFNITETGLEGGLIYALSAALRDQITASGHAQLYLDLAPDIAHNHLVTRLSRPRGKNSSANHLRKNAGIVGVKAGLLRECLTAVDFADPARLATAIKALPVRLTAPRPLDEAISSAGGVTFDALNEHLMVLNRPGVFCAGEMLDWEAPTGGYLLTACFASGFVAGKGVYNWLATERAKDFVTNNFPK